MRFQYNAPFTLTFTFLCVLVMIFSDLTFGESTKTWFTVYPITSFTNPMSYLRMVTHALGHGNWEHLISNLTFILLLGPMLEEKYGTNRMVFMSFFTALVTGVANAFFFQTGLLGASGIVFMMILLSSFANFRSGTIPLTFLLGLVLFLGKVILSALQTNQISEFAHVVGGICGSIFGFSRGTDTV